nr:hypothetical protein [Saprospiraceae bacterium]
MNIIKFKMKDLLKSKSRLLVLVVMVFWCFSHEISAQTKSDLDPSTQEMLQTAFEQEMESLKDE